MENLAPFRHQPTLFLAELVSADITEIITNLEHPLFALSTKPDVWPHKYEDGHGNWIAFEPSWRGLPTIFDQDVLIYGTSKIMAALNRGADPGPRVHLTATDLLEFTNRRKGGSQYRLLEEAIMRVTGLRIVTNIRSDGLERTDFFGGVVSKKARAEDWWAAHMIIRPAHKMDMELKVVAGILYVSIRSQWTGCICTLYPIDYRQNRIDNGSCQRLKGMTIN